MNPKLIVQAGPAKGLVYEIVKPEIAIGRHESNSSDTLDLKDKVVSRNHCRLIQDGETFLLRDSGSRNGTYVNGSLVKETVLKHRDEIRVGETWLMFLLHEGDEGELATNSVRFGDDDQNTQSLVLLQAEDSLYLNAAKASTGKPSARIEQNYQMLLQLGREINSIRNPDQLQQRLLELIFTAIPAERGAILMTAPSGGDFVSRVIRYRSQQIKGQDLTVSRTILHQAKETDGGVLNVQVGAENLSSVEKSLLMSGAKSVLAARLMVSAQVFGVVYLDTTNPKQKFDNDHLQLLVAIANLAASALETAHYVERLNYDRQRLQEELNASHEMVGESEPMKTVRSWIAKVAPTNASVLIRGESGTGKELVARAIHHNSERKDEPFIAINCATLPEHLVESELFGHEKDAFTGAGSKKPGKFKLADGGTIFLDEVGELKPELQAKLLRVLQESEIEPLGKKDPKPIKVDVRVIAATNKNLEVAIKEGSFRDDLFFRLNVLPITLPPLRQRKDDIRQLADYFVAKYASKHKRRVKGISSAAFDRLDCYDWPGNVRELENAIQSAVVMGTTELVLPEDLPSPVFECQPKESPRPLEPTASNGTVSDNTPNATTHHFIMIPMTDLNFSKSVQEAKTQIIRTAWETASGNRTETANLLGIHPNNFDRLARQYLLRPDKKSGDLDEPPQTVDGATPEK